MKIEETGRGFCLLTHTTYPPGIIETRLVQESSAIGNYEDAYSKPGSSFLWIGREHHLNREEVAELVGYLRTWLSQGRMGVSFQPKPPEQIEREGQAEWNQNCSKWMDIAEKQQEVLDQFEKLFYKKPTYENMQLISEVVEAAIVLWNRREGTMPNPHLTLAIQDLCTAVAANENEGELPPERTRGDYEAERADDEINEGNSVNHRRRDDAN